MSNNTKKPLASLIGATIVTTLSAAGTAHAAQNPFALKEMSSGYMVAEGEVSAPGGQVVPAKGKAEGACGEGKCGAEMMKQPEMKCGAGMKDMQKKPDPAADKKAMEGKCAGMKMDGGAPKAP
jgi:uncharacterized low-complexity protein